MKFFLVVGLAVSGSLANYFEASIVEKRDIIKIPCSESGRKDCGTGCIELSETCCPDGKGGCPASSVCWLGDNGQYGCCPRGETCDGPGGVISRPGGIITSTINIPGHTNTGSIPDQPPTTTAEPPATTEAPEPTTTEEPSVSLPILTIPSGTVPSSAPIATTSSPPIVAGAAALGLSASTLLRGALAGVLALFF